MVTFTGTCGSPKKTNGAPAMFFPTTTITANGVARVTTLENGADALGNGQSNVGIKMETNGPPSCCGGEE